MKKVAMNKLRKLTSIFITVAALIMSVSCKNIFDSPKVTGKAVICPSIESARTIFPVANINSLNYFKLYKVVNEEEIDLFDEPCYSLKEFCHKQISVEPGEYTLVLKAKADTTNFKAQKTVTLTEGNNGVSFELVRTDYGNSEGEAYGEIDIRFCIPSDFNTDNLQKGSLSFYSAETDEKITAISDSSLISNYLYYTVPNDFTGTDYPSDDYFKKIKIDSTFPEARSASMISSRKLAFFSSSICFAGYSY